MTLPSFLIIGAMKAGTTSLFRDLRGNNSLFLPSDKELHLLNTDEVFTESGIREYESYFKSAIATQKCGEASTGYTKLPDIQGVPKRASEILGSDLKLIYLVRNPVGRLISQYHHNVNVGGLMLPINEAIKDYSPLINYSKYAMQLQPWIESFGIHQLKIVVFEEYINNRIEIYKSICEFLDVSLKADHIKENVIFNKGSGRPMGRGPFAAFSRTSIYQKLIRPLLPLSARDKLRKIVLPPSPQKEKPSPSSIEWIVDQLQDDMESFRQILGESELPWDLSKSVERFS